MNVGAGRAPSATLPLRYLVAAAAAFVLAAAGVLWLAPALGGHYYHPRLVALTHTVTLGWVTMTIIGASYQLVPVVLERPLWSQRLARWTFVTLVAGLAGMIPHFFIAHRSGLAWAAGLVALAAGAHVLNILLTLRGLVRWPFTARLVALAHVGLAATAASGLLIGIDRAWPFLPGGALANLHAHVHVALLGWIVPMVIGVAARVYPMFLLAREPEGWGGAVQFWGLVAGAPGVAVGLALGAAPLVAGAALAVAAALAAHLAWMVEIVRTRRRPGLDWPIRFVLTGAVFLVPAALTGLALAFGFTAGPRAALAYAVLALGGWASLTIVGMMLKIVPFLVWYRVYGARVGRAPVPTLAGLSSARAESLAYWLLAAGIGGLAGAVAVGDVGAIRLAGALVTAGAVAYATALGHVLVHLVRREPAGVVPAPAAAGRAS